MDPKVWVDPSDTYITLGQIPRPVSSEEVMINELVLMTKNLKVQDLWKDWGEEVNLGGERNEA